jgi:outer membrane autotransporter protein
MAAFGGETALAASNPFAGQYGGGASSDSQFGRLGTFFNVQYVTGDEDDTAYQPGFDFHGWGFTAGLDYRFNDNFTGGASLNYGDGSSDFNNNRGDLDTNAWGGTLYGTYFLESGLYVNGLLGYSRFDYDMKRRINYSVAGNAANQTAKSSPDSNAFSASLGAGYNFAKDAVTLAPYLRFDYLQNKVDSYSESMSSPTTTGGSMALNYKSQKYKSFTSNLGLQLARAFSQSFGVLVPQLTLEWVHEFENDQQKAGVQFTNDINGTNFFVLTNNPDRNYFDLGLAVSAQLAKGRSGFLSYNTLVGYKDVNYNAINAGIRFEID